jgi:hypothetical protein
MRSPTDGRARRTGAAAVALLVLAGAGWMPPAAAGEGVPFIDGRWAATAVQVTGGIDNGDLRADFDDSEVDFIIDVRAGAVTEGRLDVRAGIHAEATEGGTGDFLVSGSVDLGGSARRVVGVGGRLRFQGTIVTESITVGINRSIRAGDENVGFSPQSVTCTQATGDLAVEGRQVQEAGGFSSGVRALFLAVRVPPDVDDFPPDLAEAFADLMADLADAVRGRPTAEEILDLARRVEELDSAVVGLAFCEGPPPGFEEGLARDDFFREMFRQLLEAAIAREIAFNTFELIMLLGVAYSTGVAGEYGPDPIAGGELHGQFESVLGERLDAAAAATPPNLEEMQDVILAALMYGMSDLHDRGVAAYRAATE